MRDTRIEFRSSPQEKDLLMLAAELMGSSVSVFLRNAALQAANEAIQANESIKLSAQDRNLFLQTLDQPPKPNAKLEKAMKKYKEWK